MCSAAVARVLNCTASGLAFLRAVSLTAGKPDGFSGGCAAHFQRMHVRYHKCMIAAEYREHETPVSGLLLSGGCKRHHAQPQDNVFDTGWQTG